MAGTGLCEPRCADYVAGAVLCEPPCAEFVAGTGLCEPPCADYVAGTGLCEPPCFSEPRRGSSGVPTRGAVTRVRSPLFVAREPRQHRSACVAVDREHGREMHLQPRTHAEHRRGTVSLLWHGGAHQMLEEMLLTLKTPPTSRARSSCT